MKRTRILSLILAILMLGSTLLVFAACSDEGEGGYEISDNKSTVDLTGYGLVYGDSQNGGSYTNTFRTQMDRLASKLSDATGLSFKASSMARANKDVNAKEILVGLTTREESQTALTEIEGDGFIIKVLANKIVILGTSNVFTLMAVNYFEDQYLKGTEESTKLSVNETVRANNVSTLVVTDSAAESTDGVYTYVHSASLGKRPSAYISVSTNPKTSTYQEYEQYAIEEQISKHLQSISKLGKKYFPMEADDKTTAKEVLIGRVNRPESTEALSTIAANEFVIASKGEKIVVNAWSEAALRQAVAAYRDLMTEGTVKEGDGKRVVLPTNFRLTGTPKTEYVMDFPKPEGEGISLYNTMDANDNALQYLYTGSGVTEAAYKDYCKKLQSEGYTIYQQTESEGSIFTFFTNTGENTALYVAYNAFAHQNEFGEYDWTVSKKIDSQVIDIYKYDPCIRIVSSTIEDAHLPNKALLSQKQSYNKVTDSMITTMPIYSKAVGLSYVVTLEDGRFVVFDGGGVNESGGTEHEILWTTLLSLYRKIRNDDTAEPTAQDPIRIAGWVLTHAHWDHYYAFQQMAKKYGSTGKLAVDYMIANIPGEESVYTLNEIAVCMTPEGVKSLQGSIKGGFEYIKVHTGQKIYLANLEIEVLTTWEDLNPIVPNTSNDSNTVLRFTMSNKQAPSATPTTIIWTGDANRAQSRFMCATYGPALKADMVSVAHHGNAGCEVEFYDMVSPTAIWWPHNATQVNNYLDPAQKTKGWQWEVDQFFYNEIATVKYLYASGVKGGAAGSMDFFTTLVLTKDGPDYENIFDVVSGEKLIYTVGAVDACMKK